MKLSCHKKFNLSRQLAQWQYFKLPRGKALLETRAKTLSPRQARTLQRWCVMGMMPDVSLSLHCHWQVDRAMLVSPLGNGKHHKIKSTGRCLSNRTQSIPLRDKLLLTSSSNIISNTASLWRTLFFKKLTFLNGKQQC